MDLVVESLKRLYKNGSVDATILDQLVALATITQNEKDYIMRKEGE